LRRDRAMAHATSGWDGAEMYQRLSDQDPKEEGRKYADIEIPFFKDSGNVVSMHAQSSIKGTLLCDSPVGPV